MKKLFRYLRNYKKESIIGPLFKLTEAIFELIVPIIMSQIIDIGIAGQDTGYIFRKGGLLVLMGFLGLICALTAQYFAARASVGFGTELRHDMFTYFTGLSYSGIDEKGSAALINRLNVDVNQVQSGVNLGIRLLLRSPFIVVGAVIMSFTIDAHLALIFLLAAPLIGLALYLIMNRTIPMMKKMQDGLDKISARSGANISGVRVIRAFARQKSEIVDFKKDTDELYGIGKNAGYISSLTNPLSYALLNGAIILVIWFGAFKVDTGRITQGEVIALVNYLYQILIAMIALVNLINTLTKAIASSQRVCEVFDPDYLDVHAYDSREIAENVGGLWERKKKKSGKAGSKVKTERSEAAQFNKNAALIEFEDVSFSYPSAGDKALEKVSFRIERGETVGIIGGTGSGKTTLINLMAGFYRPDSGKIMLGGTLSENVSDEDKRRMFAIVPQKKNLFAGSIRENLLFGREASEEELKRALEISQSAEFVNRYEDGLDHPVQQQGTNLSGGQQQRLTIARALVKRQEVLILDDSASALDLATDAALRKAIDAEYKDSTVIIVSQRIGTIMNSDRIIVMDDGRICGIGTHSELIGSCPVYREIYDSQMK